MDLDAEVERSRRSVERLQRESERLRTALVREQERLALLQKLRNLDQPESSRAPGRGASLENAVVGYLTTQGKPLHISTLRALLLKDGVPIPGKGLDANVITRIRRDNRIARAPGMRGFYILGPG
jgi:hypothetical protein